MKHKRDMPARYGCVLCGFGLLIMFSTVRTGIIGLGIGFVMELAGVVVHVLEGGSVWTLLKWACIIASVCCGLSVILLTGKDNIVWTSLAFPIVGLTLVTAGFAYLFSVLEKRKKPGKQE